MRIMSPIDIPILRHFMSGCDAITCYQPQADGSVECFSVSECDTCGKTVKNPNSIIFTAESVRNRMSVFSRPDLKLSPYARAFILEEICPTDDGYVCETCYSKVGT